MSHLPSAQSQNRDGLAVVHRQFRRRGVGYGHALWIPHGHAEFSYWKTEDSLANND